MGLLTGTPVGTIISQDEIYVEGAPYLYFQSYSATELHHPDTDNFYYGLSGTATYPVYNVGCFQDMSLADNVTMNMIRCDHIGDKDAIEKRNHLEITLTISTLLPLPTLKYILKGSTVTETGDFEKMGLGQISNSRYVHVYMPKVYDEDAGDYLIFHLHKCKFVDAWTINFRQGQEWQLTGVKLMAFADDTKPSNQLFGTIIRYDPSAI
jgi:hypothetical protein